MCGGQVHKGQRVAFLITEAQCAELKKYGHDLTEAAKAGRLDPVIGRDGEIRRMIQILSRRTKNNPVEPNKNLTENPRSITIQSCSIGPERTTARALPINRERTIARNR